MLIIEIEYWYRISDKCVGMDWLCQYKIGMLI